MGTICLVRLLLLLLAALSCCFPDESSSSTPPPGPSSSSPVCAGTGWGALPVPVVLAEALLFCGLSVGMTSCCNALDDAALMEQYFAQLANRSSNQACPPSAIKRMLCSRCIPSSDPDEPETPALGDVICTASPPPPSSASAPRPGTLDDLCLERIAAGSYNGFTPYPPDVYSDSDTRNRAFIWTREAKIWAVSVPTRGSGAALLFENARPFLDLADRVHYDAARGLGLMGVALDPRFATTGRLYTSYSCDSFASPACAGGSAAAAPPPPSRPCRYLLVVAEFSAAKDSAGDYSKATRADPSQVRRIFNACLPEAESSSELQHAGQLLFRSGDHYMYLVLGTGGEDEEANDGQFDLSSQNKSGEIIRFDVGATAAGQVSGNVSMEAKVFARSVGFLRGCSVDSGRPYNFYCTGVDQQCGEQVYLITDKPGSYDSSSPGKAVAVSIIIDHGRPPPTGVPTPPSIVAGIVYRGLANPSLRGRYLYVYGSTAWAAMETPASSRRYVTTRIPNVRCSRSSPVPCSGSGIGIGGRVLSLGEGYYYSNDAFLLATDGVYRLAPPGLCDAPPAPAPPKVAPGTYWVLLAVGSILGFAIALVCAKIFRGRRD